MKRPNPNWWISREPLAPAQALKALISALGRFFYKLSEIDGKSGAEGTQAKANRGGSLALTVARIYLDVSLFHHAFDALRALARDACLLLL